MIEEKYNVFAYSIATILGFIDAGDIAIPEIQRPFVWKRTQVRDLIDSLYNGYPTGYLIIWQNHNVKLKDGKLAIGKKILIDGQQRVTALMAAISGKSIIDDDYKSTRIKIAFNPTSKEDEVFAVQDSSHLKSKKWIPDISEIFKPKFNAFNFTLEYCENNPEAIPGEISSVINRLRGIAARQIGVIELIPTLDIDEVTEIFIRINSQGKSLSQADFAMSKIAADEKNEGSLMRKAIDYFCHLCVQPEFYSTIEANDPAFMRSDFAPKLKWLKNENGDLYDPDYGDMLRVSFMHKFHRGKISDLVALLSGRDFETKEFKESISAESFMKLKNGVLNFMNEFNFNSFVLAVKSSGYVSSNLINSKITLDFAYTLYLLLSENKDIPKLHVRRLVQKWYVMSVLTGRYISSPETAMDRDFRNIASKGFVQFFKETEEAVLSDTFWKVGLVQNLETSAINSPYFVTFLAAQSFFGDDSLFMKGTKVSSLITMKGDVHHIFPKKYLQKNGITVKAKYNQVANYVYLDSQMNLSIGDKEPANYFKIVLEQCKNNEIKYGNIKDMDELADNLKENCIPIEIVDMNFEQFDEFLLLRRKMMAEKIEKFYHKL